MGLIKNAVEQGKQAVENFAASLLNTPENEYDVVIVGAGPAGISATLQAKKMGLKSLTLEQDTLGGTVFTFPRSKIIMTSPMDLPLHGKVKLTETSKSELLDLWNSVIDKHGLTIHENSKVEKIEKSAKGFTVFTNGEKKFTTACVLLAIGRRGSPRKLGVPGENLQKVAYRLLEPELIENKKIMIVGGGDSAIEAALLLMDRNEVTLSYRGESFSRLKPKNNEKLQNAMSSHKLKALLQSNLVEITANSVTLTIEGKEEIQQLENDLVYIFAGGELPVEFLKNAGIEITRKFGEAILKHSKN
jgi:thioredoxin reductase